MILLSVICSLVTSLPSFRLGVCSLGDERFGKEIVLSSSPNQLTQLPFVKSNHFWVSCSSLLFQRSEGRKFYELGFLPFKYKRKSKIRDFELGALNVRFLIAFGVECITLSSGNSMRVQVKEVFIKGIAFNAMVGSRFFLQNSFPSFRGAGKYQTSYINTTWFYHSGILELCLHILSYSFDYQKCSLYFVVYIMEPPSSFKDVLLSSSNVSNNATLAENVLSVAGASASLAGPVVGDALVADPVVPQFASASVVLDELPQVKQDIVELSKSCLIGKMLSSSIDTRTIISRTKADWKFVKGEVEYLEMGNGWLMLKFSNPGDLSLVWSERPWHVQGDIFVIYPWRPSFDPYLEEIKWVDLWIRIPRLPAELLNFDSVASLLSANGIGALIKLDPRSL
ncbi:uncharacterized protein LOC104884593 isoform X3 [Beta vulgaris subsp. vulgaris]|uniref:uncharacterized protein LOC104884593 isoform X3 n=1 Tax=Beta vulgaris subsp. vulgaris TaxID=3555 RepID=UPI002549A0ED|nr:uncharacterized protein LOC104884593 isoform X3 [Beta vulgaris subsp. vulgaris]XP_057252416.1 uncharacterized protein LOC104884593 isoform X3 [Beta vulgaris subsp. vulgaris]